MHLHSRYIHDRGSLPLPESLLFGLFLACNVVATTRSAACGGALGGSKFTWDNLYIHTCTADPNHICFTVRRVFEMTDITIELFRRVNKTCCSRPCCLSSCLLRRVSVQYKVSGENALSYGIMFTGHDSDGAKMPH